MHLEFVLVLILKHDCIPALRITNVAVQAHWEQQFVSNCLEFASSAIEIALIVTTITTLGSMAPALGVIRCGARMHLICVLSTPCAFRCRGASCVRIQNKNCHI